MQRTDVRFQSAGTRCAAWLYRPAQAAGDTPCVVLAHGFAAVRDQRLKAARKAPRGELKRYPVGHFDVYVGDWFERVVADETEFLTRHLMGSGVAAAAAESQPA